MAGDYPFPDCANCRWRDIPYTVTPQIIIELAENGYILEFRDEYKTIRHRRFFPLIEIHEDFIRDWLGYGEYDFPQT